MLASSVECAKNHATTGWSSSKSPLFQVTFLIHVTDEMSLHCKEYARSLVRLLTRIMCYTQLCLNIMCIFSIERVKTMLKVV